MRQLKLTMLLLLFGVVVCAQQPPLEQAKDKAKAIKAKLAEADALADEILALEEEVPPTPEPPADSVCGEDPTIFHRQFVQTVEGTCDTHHTHGMPIPDWVPKEGPLAPRNLSAGVGHEAHRLFKNVVLHVERPRPGNQPPEIIDIDILGHFGAVNATTEQLLTMVGELSPGGVNAQNHSAQVWIRWRGDVSMVYDFQNTGPLRYSKCDINVIPSELRPAIFLPVVGCPDHNEQWYMHGTVDISWLILGAPVYFDLTDNSVGNLRVAGVTGGKGSKVRADANIYLSRFNDAPRDQVYCRTAGGDVVACGPEDAYPNYFASSLETAFRDDGFGNQKIFALLFDTELAEDAGTIELPN